MAFFSKAISKMFNISKEIRDLNIKILSASIEKNGAPNHELNTLINEIKEKNLEDLFKKLILLIPSFTTDCHFQLMYWEFLLYNCHKEKIDCLLKLEMEYKDIIQKFPLIKDQPTLYKIFEFLFTSMPKDETSFRLIRLFLNIILSANQFRYFIPFIFETKVLTEIAMMNFYNFYDIFRLYNKVLEKVLQFWDPDTHMKYSKNIISILNDLYGTKFFKLFKEQKYHFNEFCILVFLLEGKILYGKQLKNENKKIEFDNIRIIDHKLAKSFFNRKDIKMNEISNFDFIFCYAKLYAYQFKKKIHPSILNPMIKFFILNKSKECQGLMVEYFKTYSQTEFSGLFKELSQFTFSDVNFFVSKLLDLPPAEFKCPAKFLVELFKSNIFKQWCEKAIQNVFQKDDEDMDLFLKIFQRMNISGLDSNTPNTEIIFQLAYLVLSTDKEKKTNIFDSIKKLVSQSTFTSQVISFFERIVDENNSALMDIINEIAKEINCNSKWELIKFFIKYFNNHPAELDISVFRRIKEGNNEQTKRLLDDPIFYTMLQNSLNQKPDENEIKDFLWELALKEDGNICSINLKALDTLFKSECSQKSSLLVSLYQKIKDKQNKTDLYYKISRSSVIDYIVISYHQFDVIDGEFNVRKEFLKQIFHNYFSRKAVETIIRYIKEDGNRVEFLDILTEVIPNSSLDFNLLKMILPLLNDYWEKKPFDLEPFFNLAKEVSFKYPYFSNEIKCFSLLTYVYTKSGQKNYISDRLNQLVNTFSVSRTSGNEQDVSFLLFSINQTLTKDDDSYNETLWKNFILTVQNEAGIWNESKDIIPRKFPNYFSSRGNHLILLPNHNYSEHKDCKRPKKGSHNANSSNDQKKANRKSLIVSIKNNKNDQILNSQHVYEETFYCEFTNSGIKYNGTSSIDKGANRFIFSGECSIVTGKNNNENTEKNIKKRILLDISKIKFIMKFQENKNDSSVFIQMTYYKTYIFDFHSEEKREQFFEILRPRLDEGEGMIKQHESKRYDFWEKMIKANGSKIQTKTNEKLLEDIKLIEAWESKEISNFEFIFYLNILGGNAPGSRSCPLVFPHIFEKLDESFFDPSNQYQYRNFGLPAVIEHETLTESKVQGNRSHPSMTVDVQYLALIRYEPYLTYHINYQSGNIDERQITNIQIGYKEREYVPEIFTSPYIFENFNMYDFGYDVVNGEKINDVFTAEWAQNNDHFSAVLRCVLELPSIRSQLPSWINLNFGDDIQNPEKMNVVTEYLVRGATPESIMAKYPEEDNNDIAHLCEEAPVFFGKVPIRVCPNQWASKLKSNPTNIWRKERKYVSQFSGSFIDANHGVILTSTCVFLGSNDKRINFNDGKKILAVGRNSCSLIQKDKEIIFIFIAKRDIQQVNLRSFIKLQNITCATFAGGDILLLATESGIIHHFLVKENEQKLIPLGNSNYQAGKINAIAASYDAGIISTIGDDGTLVIETLLDRKQIIVVPKVIPENKPVQVIVYKTGYTVVIPLLEEVVTEISIYDILGVKRGSCFIMGGIVNGMRYNDLEKREGLFVINRNGVLSAISIPIMKCVWDHRIQNASVGNVKLYQIVENVDKTIQPIVINSNEGKSTLISFSFNPSLFYPWI